MSRDGQRITLRLAPWAVLLTVALAASGSSRRHSITNGSSHSGSNASDWSGAGRTRALVDGLIALAIAIAVVSVKVALSSH